MKAIPISDFKARCTAVLRQAENSGEPVVVTRRGRPIARIEPLPRHAERRLGVFKGRMRIHGDIVHLDTVADWEMLD